MSAQSEMSSRERILAAIRHEEPDQIPLDLGATPSSGISAIAYTKKARDIKNHRAYYNDYLMARCYYASGDLETTISYCDKILKRVDNTISLARIRPKVQLLKTDALAQLSNN